MNETQVVEGLAHVRVVRTERFLADRQRALVERLRLAVFALLPIHDGQFVERSGITWMIGSEARLHSSFKLLCIRVCSGVVSARIVILKCLVDRDDIGRLSDAVASVSNVVSARIATKATVLQRAIMGFRGHAGAARPTSMTNSRLFTRSPCRCV